MMMVPIFREGTRREQGEKAIILNAEAGAALADAVRTTLGPKGMDKMLVDGHGETIITNDGVTILKEVDVEHPAAKMVIETAKAQDDECGDGTTTVVILTGELLKEAIPLIRKNIHPTMIIEGYQRSLDFALQILNEKSISITDPQLHEGKVKLNDRAQETLRYIAQTSMTGKTTEEYKDYLSEIVVEAIEEIAVKEKDERGAISDISVDVDDIQVIKQRGRPIKETYRMEGVVLKKELLTRSGPKRIESASVILISGSLKPKTVEMRFDNIEAAEEAMGKEGRDIKCMIDIIVDAGADIVVVQKDVSDELISELEAHKIVAFNRVSMDEMDLIAKATGATPINRIEDLKDDDMGWVNTYREQKHEGEPYQYFDQTSIEELKWKVPQTILVRGATDHIVDEVARAIHDALSTVAVTYEDQMLLEGGGASYMAVSVAVDNYAQSIEGRQSFAVEAYARALEVVPRTLAENAGMDAIDTLLALKAKHSTGQPVGVDVMAGAVGPLLGKRVVEPFRLVEQALIGATETACMILRIDDVIAAKGIDGDLS